MGLASRARQSWSKNQKRPHFASLPQANPSPESKNFFKNRTKTSSRICRGFEHLSSCSSWRVITKKPRAIYWLWWALKGALKGDKQSARPCCPLQKLLLIKKVYHLNTLHLYPAQTQKRSKKELPNSYIKLYRHPIVRFL